MSWCGGGADVGEVAILGPSRRPRGGLAPLAGLGGMVVVSEGHGRGRLRGSWGMRAAPRGNRAAKLALGDWYWSVPQEKLATADGSDPTLPTSGLLRQEQVLRGLSLEKGLVYTVSWAKVPRQVGRCSAAAPPNLAAAVEDNPERKGEGVAKKPPWYSKKELDVYHDDDECDKGNNIEPENIAYGTGNLPKCETCKRLG